jgi:hypothetical protein
MHLVVGRTALLIFFMQLTVCNQLKIYQLPTMDDLTGIDFINILGKEKRDEKIMNLLLIKKNKNKKFTICS